jgi:ATP-dependent DNA helicase RecG
LISNTASQSEHPPINPQIENVLIGEDKAIVVHVVPGISKPYMDNAGSIWVKNGADKGRLNSREEMQRMFQSAGLLHADEIPVNGVMIADLDTDYFKAFYEKQYHESFEQQGFSLPVVLENMNLMKKETFNLAGTLLFTKNPHVRLPTSTVKAVCFPGDKIHVSEYRDSEDITGKLEDLFKKALGFITRNIGHRQGSQDINTQGILEIPKIALEELLTNALIHRDFFISAHVRILIFDNRIELISPGHLPNNLTLENIKSGISSIRNPILASYGTKILPYRGLGSGIRRALEAYPDIDFTDDRDGNQFIVTIHRKTTTKS